MTVLELAVGVAGGFLLHDLVHTVIELPFAYAKYRAHKRKMREMQTFMHEAVDGLVKHLESDEHKAHVKGAKNARTSSKTAKKASTSASKPQRKAGSSTRNSAKKVQTVKKGA